MLEGGDKLIRYYVELTCKIEAKNAESMEKHAISIMDALLEEPGVVDPDVTAALADGVVTLSMSVDAESDSAALEASLVKARSAIHAAKGSTPTWPSAGDIMVPEGFDARVRVAATC